MALEPLRQRHVVGVEPRDVPAGRPVERAVERRGKTALLIVAKHRHSRVADGLDRLGGAVVDEDQLEVRQRLSEHALDRFVQEALVVVHGEQDGDERHGR